MKDNSSYSTNNMRHLRRALLLMALYPLIIFLLTSAVFYRSVDKGVPGLAQQSAATEVTPETIVTGLDTPWAMQFAPDGRLYFTERPGRIRVYENGQLRSAPVATIANTESLSAEEGLQGLALHPNFASNGWLYVYYTYTSGSNLKNRLARYTLNPSTGSVVSGPVTLIDNIPGYKFHNGGRIKFGPDGKLYVATGSATPDTGAQDLNSLSGKILRVNDDGSAASGNPFGTRVWSYGHRNPQGLAWHPVTKELWSTEHGPSSSAPYCCNDEVNKIVAGANYGWPRYYGMNGQDSNYSYFNINQTKPVWTSGTSVKWAPGGAMFYSGGPLGSPWTNSLIFTGLGGIDKSNQALFRLQLSSDGKTPVQLDRLYKDTYGRLRDVVQGPDGAIYIATSNNDGRGSAGTYGSDKIIRLKPVIATNPSPTPPPPPPAPNPTPNPTPTPGQTPYVSQSLPGKLEAENYDKGGEGVAYHDSDTPNQGGKYRTDSVDVESNGAAGYSVGWVTPGEWLEYTLNVAQSGTYDITFRVASGATTTTGSWTLKSGATTLATATTGGTGGWYAWKDVTVKDVTLSAGSNKVIRLEASGAAVNLDYITFTKQGGTTTPSPAPPSPPPAPQPTPPIEVPDANPTKPVPIPPELPVDSDGNVVADFNGDGLNDVVKDINSDGSIDPNTEIIVDGQNNQSLTDQSKAPIAAEDYSEYVYERDNLYKPAGTDGAVSLKLGANTEVKLPKPVAYTFLVAQGIAITGIGTYLAITKLSIFASLRGRWGL